MTGTDQTQSKADEEFNNKNYKEALQYYTELINKKIKPGDNHHKRAKCFLELRINKNGLGDAQAAHDINPNSAEILETLIKCCITLNDLDKATVNLQLLSQIDPNNALARDYGPKVNELKALYTEVQKEMEIKNYKGALANIKECCNKIECNSYYRNEKIRILIYIGNYTEAEKEISDMLFSSKVDVEAIQLRALLLWHKGKEILALRELELADKLSKYLGGYQITSTIATKLHMQCHFMKYAENKLEANDYETAIKYFQESITQDVHNSIIAKKALLQQAKCYAKLDQTEAAIEHCNKSLELDPNFVAALELQAECYKKVNELKKAEENYKKLVEKNKDNDTYKIFLKEVQQPKGAQSTTENKKGETETDWEILGIKEDATLKQVQEAYRKMAKLYHTDQHISKDDATQEKNLKRMEQINQAKENMEKRIKNKQLQENAQPPVEIK